MLNGIFVVIVLISILLAAHNGEMKGLTDAVLRDSRTAVDLAIKLIGVMAFFLGLMRVAQDAGLLRAVARVVGPPLRLLFPSVPVHHPAMSAMILNISANLFGLGNAATPFGIKAMEELDRLNPRKGTATNAMVLFLAINTAGFALLPTTVLGIRASLDSQNAAAILFPTWFASGCATVTAVLTALLLARLPHFRRSEPRLTDSREDSEPAGTEEDAGSRPRRRRWATPVVAGFWLLLIVYLVRFVFQSATDRTPLGLLQAVASYWALPLLVGGVVLFGWSRGVRVYDSLVEGAKEGFHVALRIIPYLVAILVAVGMFRASGGIDLFARIVGPVTTVIGMPAEALPMALLRPLSGSGALGVMTEVMTAHGPDSLIGHMVSTFLGSTETTFYVLAVYFGAIGIKRTRHTLPACLTADVAGILAAVLIVNLIFG